MRLTLDDVDFFPEISVIYIAWYLSDMHTRGNLLENSLKHVAIRSEMKDPFGSP